MGADIHIFAEVKRNNKWERFEEKVFPPWGGYGEHSSCPFDYHSYGMFGFLANVRNYSLVPTLANPKGLPDDSEWLNSDYDNGYTNKENYEEDSDYHSHSFFTIKELINFDYDKTFEDRRVTKQIAPNMYTGAGLAEEGEGEITTYRTFLGENYFRDLEILKTLGNPEDVRIIFWFDN